MCFLLRQLPILKTCGAVIRQHPFIIQCVKKSVTFCFVFLATLSALGYGSKKVFKNGPCLSCIEHTRLLSVLSQISKEPCILRCMCPQIVSFPQ